jgi:hypothetical protein
VKRRTVEEAGLRVVAGGRNRSNRRVGAPFYTHRRRGRYWGSAGVRFFGLSPYFLSRGSSRGTAGVALSLCLFKCTVIFILLGRNIEHGIYYNTLAWLNLVQE